MDIQSVETTVIFWFIPMLKRWLSRLPGRFPVESVAEIRLVALGEMTRKMTSRR